MPQEIPSTGPESSMDIELVKEIKGNKPDLNDGMIKDSEDDDVILCNDSKVNFSVSVQKIF